MKRTASSLTLVVFVALVVLQGCGDEAVVAVAAGVAGGSGSAARPLSTEWPT
jgi:hypothetical protein